MGILLVNEYGRDTREVPIHQSPVRIGRDPRGEVVLGDVGVSRAHARILCGEKDIVLEDLGSTNGTLVNDRKIGSRERCSLRHGDIIRVGRSVIQLLIRISRRISGKLAWGKGPRCAEVKEDSAASPCLFHLDGFEALLLVVPERGAVTRHVLRSDRVRIGRSPESDIVTGDPSVSEHHAEIVYNKEGFHLVDRDSGTGTYLDGVPVRTASLESRSYIRFGKLKALFVVREEGRDPPDASFNVRDRLMGLYPDRADAVMKAFRDCREGALNFAEELIVRGVLDPEEWWDVARGSPDDGASRRAGWLSRLSFWRRQEPGTAPQ
jgi:pSer/pThr/pTyr-binding forkhead associated (FHA) protein